MRRSPVALGFASLLLGSLLAACGGGGSAGGGGTVNVWMYPIFAESGLNEKFWSSTTKAFEEQHPDIDVEVEILPWDNRDQKLATAFAAGTAPDLVLLGPDQVPQYTANGSLAPVGDVVSDVRDDFVSSALEALTVENKLYVVPLYHTVTAPVYNRNVLDAAGINEPPRTWQEIRDAAAKLEGSGNFTMSYWGAPEATLNLSFYPLLWQAGGRVFAEDGDSVAFDSPAGVKALTFLADLYDQGAIPKDAVNNDGSQLLQNALGQGDVLFGYMYTPAQAKQLEEAWKGEDSVIVGKPLKQEKAVTFGLPGGLALAADSDNQQAAKKFLNYLVTPEVLKELNRKAGFIPPRQSVTINWDKPEMKAFKAALEHANPGETHPKARQVMQILARQVQAALLGKKTPEQALADAAKQANAAVERSG